MATMTDKEDVVLGSGDLYIIASTGTIPTNAEIEVDANKIGHIQGGAALDYKNEWKTVSDDMGVIVKRFLTKEELTFKSGLLAWNGKCLAMLCNTARVTETAALRTVKIGGLKNSNGKSYVIHFVHTKDNGLKIRVTIVGTSNNGFTLTFDPEKETVIDAEFAAQASDSEGTLVTYTEELTLPTPQD